MKTTRLFLLSKSIILRPTMPLPRALSVSFCPAVKLFNPTKTFPTQSCKYSSSLFPRRAMYSPLVAVKRVSLRCKVTQSKPEESSPLSTNTETPRSSQWGERPPSEMGPLFPGCDYKHWLIVMEPLNEGKASKQEQIDHYIKTLAKVVGSEETAKKAIYNVSFERYYGFGCEIDEETSDKLQGLPGVNFVLPDSYVDVENKDYGATLLVNGKIVERPPERQKRVNPPPQPNNSARPRYNDRTRYVRRRENQSQGQ